MFTIYLGKKIALHRHQNNYKFTYQRVDNQKKTRMEKSIIDKVIANTATTKEASEVASWFATDEGQDYLAHRFDDDAAKLQDEEVNLYKASGIHSARMKSRLQHQIRRRFLKARVQLIAAILLPLVILSGITWFAGNRLDLFGKTEYATLRVPLGEKANLVLQDGTSVQINSGSTIEYPKHFGLFDRKVTFSGEAYFSVAKEPSRPFVISVGGVEIKVTGTKFNVKAYPDEPTVSVALEEGKVSLIDKDKHIYPLQPRQSVLYNKVSGRCVISQIDEMETFTAWRSSSLNFNRVPLGEILKVIERQHNVVFTAEDPSCLRYRFTISTVSAQVIEILRELERVSDIRFRQVAGNRYKVYSRQPAR